MQLANIERWSYCSQKKPSINTATYNLGDFDPAVSHCVSFRSSSSTSHFRTSFTYIRIISGAAASEVTQRNYNNDKAATNTNHIHNGRGISGNGNCNKKES